MMYLKVVQYMSTHAPFDLFAIEDQETLTRVSGGKALEEAFPNVKKVKQ